MLLSFLVGVGAVALVGLAMAGGGGSSDDSPSNPAEVRPVVPLKTTAEKKAGRVAVCTCYRGGAQSFKKLATCTLKLIYPDAPENKWGPLVDGARDPAVPMSDGTRKAVRWVIDRCTGLLKLQTEAERQAWCGEEEPDEPDEPDTPDTPDRTPPDDEPMTDMERVKKARELYLGLKSDTPRGARFWTPVQGQSDSMGLLRTAAAVLRSYGIASPSSSMQYAYAKAMEASAYNRKLYGRNAKADDGVLQFEGKTIRPLYNPRHADAGFSMVQARWPARTIDTAGNRRSGVTANRYGTPWLPGLDEDALESGYVVPDPEKQEPPAELLELLREA